MGQVFAEIDDRLAAWIARQHVFFVATAPLAASGLVNCSPKAARFLAVLGPRTVAYLDLTGSGIETVAHLRENGRITLMLCAFEEPPRILRLYGRGEALEPGSAGFEALRGRFPDEPGARAILRVELERIADSCGYGVPLYRYERERTQLRAWAERKGPEGIRAYWRDHNAVSVDGLPGLRGEGV
jgi:hypothetical protein